MLGFVEVAVGIDRGLTVDPGSALVASSAVTSESVDTTTLVGIGLVETLVATGAGTTAARGARVG